MTHICEYVRTYTYDSRTQTVAHTDSSRRRGHEDSQPLGRLLVDDSTRGTEPPVS